MIAAPVKTRVHVSTPVASGVAMDVAQHLADAEYIVARAALANPTGFIDAHASELPNYRHFSQPDLMLIYDASVTVGNRDRDVCTAIRISSRILAHFGYWDATLPHHWRGALWSVDSLCGLAAEHRDKDAVVSIACGAIRRFRRQLSEGDRRIRDAAEVYAGGPVFTKAPPGELAIRMIQTSRLSGIPVEVLSESM